MPRAAPTAHTAFRERAANKIGLQKLIDAEIRETFDLSAQMMVRAISKWAEAEKRDKWMQPTFRAQRAIIYQPSFRGKTRSG
jgi:hypothetical protein